MRITVVTLAILLLLIGRSSAVQAQDDTVKLLFQITLTGMPCPNATYWGIVGVPDSEGFGIQLTDPDGDGVYTGSTSATVGNSLFIQLVQGTGTQQTFFGPLPGDPQVTLKDLGLVPITGDMLFEATSVSCPAGLPDTGARYGLLAALLAGGLCLLAVGSYLHRRMWQHT